MKLSLPPRLVFNSTANPARSTAIFAAITALFFVAAIDDARAQESTTNTNEVLFDPYFGFLDAGESVFGTTSVELSSGTLSFGGTSGGLPLGDDGGTFTSQAVETATLSMREASFPQTFLDGGGFFNNVADELGMYANFNAKQAVAWADFGTSGFGGTARDLQVGDVFKITVAATRAFGQIGFSLNAGGTQGSSYNNRTSGSRLYFNTDNYGAWYVNRSGGNSTLQYVPLQDTYKDYIFTVRITSETTADVFLTVDGTDYRAYNLTMNGSAGANISALSIYGSDMWDGNSNQDAFWKPTSQIQNTGRVEVGYFLASGAFTSGKITDGLEATSTSTSSANEVHVGGDAGSQVNFNQDNTYTGTTTVNANATLEAQHANALGGTGAGTTVSSGGALKLFSASSISYASESLTLNGVGVSGANGALRNVGGDNTWNGNITLGSNSRINADTSGGSGSLAIAGNIDGGANALFVGATANVSISGVLSGEGSVSTAGAPTTSLYKDGAGTLTLSGENTYTGTTLVVAGTLELDRTGGNAISDTTDIRVSDGAFLLISQSNQVNSTAADVTLSGGTITRASGVSEVFGDLNLTAASFLDFGSGTAGTVQFQDYSNTESSLVTVNNFFPGNKLQFTSTSFGAGDLTNFSFSSDVTTGTEGGYFTITAIPEPSTYAAAAGLLVLFLWPVRRRLIKDAKSILGLRAPARERLEAYRNA